MFNPDKFRSHFAAHEDFAKASKFEVRIQPPAAAPDLASSAQGLRFQCENAEIPGYTINTVDNRIYGVPNPVASTAAFSDITLTFICAGDMWEKKFFDRWMDIIVPINNYNPRYKDDYKSPKIEINQYSEFFDENEPEVTASTQTRYSAILFEAFPTSMAPLSLNWGDDGILKLAVTFKYEYWTPGATAKARSSTIERPQAQPNGSALQRYTADNTSIQAPSIPQISALGQRNLPSSIKDRFGGLGA